MASGLSVEKGWDTTVFRSPTFSVSLWTGSVTPGAAHVATPLTKTPIGEKVRVLIRVAEERDAVSVARGEWTTAETPGLLVGRPGEIPLSAFVAKIAALSGRGSYWVAEEGDAVIGHAFLDPMGMAGNAHVYQLNVVVHPGHTGGGVGTSLMQTALDWARDQGSLEKVELSVRATNDRAISLYRKFGFVEEGRLSRRVRTADGAFIDDLLMSWMPER